MAYAYYQTQVPNWGTPQFQFGAPPVPAFHPQPSWKGYDFYNAHAGNPDPGFFDSIWGRLRDYMGSSNISHQDARHWHKKIYSGMTPLTSLMPADIGAAAAYEAYRTMKHNTFLYEPLSADRERQREGLIGMAVAETQRLWQYSGRTMDNYGLRAACEAAASAGSVLADRLFSYRGSLGRSNSYSSMNDAYAYDDPYRRAGRSRHNSFTAPSVVRVGGSPLMGSAPLGYAGSSVPMPIPGAAMSTGSAYGAGMPGSYGAGYGTVPPGVPGSYGGGYSNPLDGRVSPGPFGVASSATAASPYTFNGMPIGGYAGSAAAAPYGTPGAAYVAPGTAYGTPGASYTLPNGQAVPPGSTVIITQPHRSRRHSTASSHSHRHSSRHHSSREEEYERERERERERELVNRDWERADRERHERDRRRWEQEERERAYGTDEYGRYGRAGTLGSSPSGYGYGDRY